MLEFDIDRPHDSEVTALVTWAYRLGGRHVRPCDGNMGVAAWGGGGLPPRLWADGNRGVAAHASSLALRTTCKHNVAKASLFKMPYAQWPITNLQ